VHNGIFTGLQWLAVHFHVGNTFAESCASINASRIN